MASSLGGWKGDGSAFSGLDLIDSSETPSLSISSLTWGYWKMTPIEPVIELSPATIVSPASAIM
ncbi:hypothetical protein D9M72_580400 [compost metagenome]